MHLCASCFFAIINHPIGCRGRQPCRPAVQLADLLKLYGEDEIVFLPLCGVKTRDGTEAVPYK